MATDTIARKCASCGNEIIINTQDIQDVIFFNKLYYHGSCFEKTAAEKASSKRGKPTMWREALDNIWTIEADTKKMLKHFIFKDKFNTWLLSHYNIITVPSYFWQLVFNLENGSYKNTKCKPVSIETLCGAWQWGQRKLDEISVYNKTHNKGPKDDEARLKYDLAIIVGKIPNFLAYKEKQKANQRAMVAGAGHDDIDMSKIGQGTNIKKGKDVSNISEDIFVE